jgi:hypothetical protein
MNVVKYKLNVNTFVKYYTDEVMRKNKVRKLFKWDDDKLTKYCVYNKTARTVMCIVCVWRILYILFM